METYKIASNWAAIADTINSENSGLGRQELTTMWRFRRIVNQYNAWATEQFPKYEEYAAFDIVKNKVVEISHNWGKVFDGERDVHQYTQILATDNFVKFGEMVQTLEGYNCDSCVNDIGNLSETLSNFRHFVLDLRVGLGDEGVCRFLGDTTKNKAYRAAE